jgi:hypothetical protein
MAIVKPDLIHDAGKVAADGSRIAGCQNGVPAKSATGIYTYTLRGGAGLDVTECAAIVQSNTVALSADIVQTTDFLFTVNINTDAGVDTDGIWSFVLLNLS